jgi:RHS repeat-associated protein
MFTGREDDGTGLLYYRARYYDPASATFISQDPLGLGGGDINLYRYVASDPFNLTDPDGLHWLINPATGRPTPHVHRHGVVLGTPYGTPGATPSDPLHGCAAGCQEDRDVCTRQARFQGVLIGGAANLVCKRIGSVVLCRVLASIVGGSWNSNEVDICNTKFDACLRSCTRDPWCE